MHSLCTGAGSRSSGSRSDDFVVDHDELVALLNDAADRRQPDHTSDFQLLVLLCNLLHIQRSQTMLTLGGSWRLYIEAFQIQLGI